MAGEDETTAGALDETTAGALDEAVAGFLEESAEELYDEAPCAYVSTLLDGTIVRANQTFLRWLGYRREEVVGHRRFQDLLSPGGRIYHETHYAPLLRMQGSVREIAVDLVAADGRRLPVLVNSVLKRDADGRPALVRTTAFDATERREYERELLRARRHAEESESRARVLARTLQESLIPPAPPEIPGLEVAAAYRPAGDGGEVGGDFYDVFETGDGDWAAVLGDVLGKGAEAAAVTALARYTVRAAAVAAEGPAPVLATLNAALIRQGVERFCTVVYARLRREDGGGFAVTVSSGGHPLPLLVREGRVEPVGRPGDLLGVWDAVAVHEVTMALQPGDALVLYTDGVTEGRRGARWFGEERLRALLASAAGEGAAEITRRLVDAVVEFQNNVPRDDIALVVVRVPEPVPDPAPLPAPEGEG